MAETISISPELLEKCQEMFMAEHSNSSRIKALLQRVADGKADLNDSAEYSRLIGEILGKVLGENITFDVLPENTLFWNIAKDVVQPMLEQNYNLVNVMATDCQQIVYDKAKIGLKIKSPPLNEDKIDGILNNITRVCWDETQLADHLLTYAENFTESCHDDFVQEQAKRANKAGLKTKVIRMATNCCEWCSSLAGIYDYDDVKATGSSVWLRHVHCDCKIIYQSEKESHAVENYKTETSGRNSSGRNKNRVSNQESYDFIRRNQQRQDFIKRMVEEKGWTEKRAAIYFNKNKLWLET